MKNIKVASELLAIVTKTEQLSVDRQALIAIVQDETKTIDEQRKALKTKAVELIKSVASAIEATTIANTVAPACPPKSDNAAHKRMARRRSWLCGVLSSAYSDYDFVVPPRATTIVAEYVGTSSHREARELITSIERLTTLGFHLPAIKEEDVVKAMASQSSSAPVQVLEVSGDFASALARINAKVAGFSTMLEGDTNKAAKATKQKAA